MRNSSARITTGAGSLSRLSGIALATVLSWAPFAVNAVPAAKIGRAPLIATSVPDGTGGYSTSIAHTPSVTGGPVPNEIVELSRALGGNVDEIYDFVRNYVDTVFIFGAQKGALGAIVDKSGTPFDQAELMVALLNQANYTTAYKFGTITLTGAQFQAWTNITNAQAACDLLASGGIPASVNGSAATLSCTTISNTSTVSTVTMYHVWVDVLISGTHYVFDPSYKPYVFTPQIANLNGAAGLTTGQALTAATGSGYTSGTNSGVNYVQGLTASPLSEQLCGGTTSGLTATICTYAGNLQTYIQSQSSANGPLANGKIIDLVGGREISRCNSPTCEPVRQTSLPYSASNVTRTWAGATGVPDQFRASLTVTLTKANSAGTYDTTVNGLKLFADDTYGRKLTYSTNFITSGTQPFVGNLELVDEFGTATVLSTYQSPDNSAYSVGTISLVVTHPYLADDAGSLNPTGTYMNTTVSRVVRYATPFTIVHGWGETNRGLVDKWSSRPDAEFVGLMQPNGCETCTYGHKASKGDGQREQLTALWLLQSSKAARLHASIANSVYTHHHTVGIVAGDTEVQTTNTSPPGSPANYVYSVIDSFDRVDADMGFSVTSTSANMSDRGAAILAIAETIETLEGSVSAQQADLPDVTSTATRFEWGNNPPVAEDPSGSSGSIGPRRFYDFNGNSSLAQNLMLVEGKLTTTESESHGGGEPTIGPLETASRQAAVSGLISTYGTAGFRVIASEEAFLGPGQRGGGYMKQTSGLYLHRYSKQRGGAFVAYLLDSNGNPTQIAHVAANDNYTDGASGIKGGGGGTQPDQQSSYDPSTAADVLKAQFVDRSTTLGVDLQTGIPTWTSPATLDVGAGKFPYSLSASFIWRGGVQQDQTFSQVSHIAPNTPWTTNWNSTLNISGSALEAMGEGDIRASAATVAAFMALQDVYRSSISPQREVAAVLTGAWWSHHIRGNVATVGLGSETRQFLRKFDGTWFLPGAGAYAALAQTGSRAVYVQPNCGSPPVSYVLTRGWDYSGVSFAVTNTNGDQQNFSFWANTYSDAGTYCANLHGFRLSSWTFPYGTITVNLTYQPNSVGLDELYQVSNTLGRAIHFTTSGFAGFDNTLTGADARSVGVTLSSVTLGPATDTTTDPAGAVTSINHTLTGYRYLLNNVLTADNATIPALAYTYDTLNRVEQAQDAVALRQNTGKYFSFYLGEGTRGERVDAAAGQYTVIYDIYRRPLEFIDELGRTTALTHDGRGRVSSYTYPENDQQTLAYDDHNNTTTLTRIAKPGSTLTQTAIQAVWDQTWNKPTRITDALGCQTLLAYVPAGTSGTSLLQSATRCKPDSTQANPVYQFTYNSLGQTSTATDATLLGSANTYDTTANHSNLLSTALDPTGVNSITSYAYDANGNVTSVTDPRNYVQENQYDNDRRKTVVLHHNGGITAALISAEKTVYDVLGRTSQEYGGSAFSGTTVTTYQLLKTTTYTDNSKVQTVTDGANDQTVYAYDPMDRAVLVTDPVGRRVGTVYDAAGQVSCIWRAWGSTTAPGSCGTPNPNAYAGSGQFQYASYVYSQNGKQTSALDANNNLTQMVYDGFDRLSQLTLPSTTFASGNGDGTDIEAYGYDANDNRLTWQRRDGEIISFSYDALNRMTFKHLPNATTGDVYYGWDLAGRPMFAHFGSTTGLGIDYGYDTAKRLTSESNGLSSTARAMTFQYDAANNRIRVTWPDANYTNYDFDALNRVSAIRENGATSGVGVLASYVNDPLSRLTGITRGNGTTSSMQYDLASRLQTLSHDVAGTAQDLSVTLGYTLASQLQTRTGSNLLYEWTSGAASKAYVADGLNRYTSVAGGNYSYTDGRGNLNSDGTRTFTYDVENHLLSVVGGAGLTLAYDPLGRLWQTVSGSTTTQFLYDGDRLVAEYSSTGTVLRRYVHGPKTDNPVVWYEGSGLTTRNWIHADERGSVIATTDGTGLATVYTYGPYGEPPSWSGSRFAYTGQVELPEAQLYHYKARVYDPVMGRFLQTDPIGMQDDLNLYAYTYNDPTDRTDPPGTESPVITNYSVCNLTGGTNCEQILEPYAEMGRAFPLSGAAEEYDRGNYVTAGILGALDIVPFGRLGPSALKSNMLEAGVRFAKGEEAHHIVASSVRAFQDARDLLSSLGISLDEAVNGARLDQQFHRGVDSVVHGVDAARSITDRLIKAAKGGADAVRKELQKIGKELEKSAKQCVPATGTHIC
jgi:RHS repeat-associated protein